MILYCTKKTECQLNMRFSFFFYVTNSALKEIFAWGNINSTIANLLKILLFWVSLGSILWVTWPKTSTNLYESELLICILAPAQWLRSYWITKIVNIFKKIGISEVWLMGPFTLMRCSNVVQYVAVQFILNGTSTNIYI